jgi:hypothetical protein
VDLLATYVGLDKLRKEGSEPEHDGNDSNNSNVASQPRLWEHATPFIPLVVDQGMAKLVQSLVSQRPSTTDPAWSARPFKTVMGLFHNQMRYGEAIATLSALLPPKCGSLSHACEFLGLSVNDHLSPSSTTGYDGFCKLFSIWFPALLLSYMTWFMATSPTYADTPLSGARATAFVEDFILKCLYSPPQPAEQYPLRGALSTLLVSASVFPWMLDIAKRQRSGQIDSLLRICTVNYAGLNNLGKSYRYAHLRSVKLF